MPHQPCFNFRTHGGICAGEQWIHDRDVPIARFRHDRVEQPEQNLRYFNKVLEPIELRDLRLRPGDRALFAGIQLYWKMGPVITTELIDLEIQGQGSSALRLIAVTRDPGGVATSRRMVTITYDAELDSYIYDMTAHLEIHSPEVFDTPEARVVGATVQFEYADPWYSDIPAPSVDFSGHWDKRYSRFLAEAADGSVWQMPLNHMATGIPSPQALLRDGLLVLASEPGANPAIEFVGTTADRSGVSVCNWGYDIHLTARYALDELYAPIAERVRLRLCDDEKVVLLGQRAAHVPPVVYAGFTELPLYERCSSFAKELCLNRPAPGETDPWPWLPAGEGASWCRDYGRSDSCSLQISRRSSGCTEWTMDREGPGAWTQRWTSGTGFRACCYIRTVEVHGRGACLALRWTLYNTPERYPLICSERVTGTHGWTRVQVTLPGPPPPAVSGVCIILRQDGSGTSWFDDFELEVL